VIDIAELTKYFGETKAVGPLSFTIDKGEVVGLLGLNGAGKTTTLRMLSSELLPTSGRMRVDGIDLAEEPERVRPRIGYLPDRPPLYGEMVVREYLRFVAKLRGIPSAEIARRVEAVIERTALEDWADERIDTLSHGFRQRTGIAQAIVHEPSLLLLDEPISGLDPVQIVEMRELIRSLRGEHITIVSSHILSEISETCDRLLVIRDGEIVASGSEAELSSQMVAQSLELTVRLPDGSGHRETPRARLDATLLAIDGVVGVEETACDEPGKDVVRLVVRSRQDVREAVCRTLCAAGFGVLGLAPSARELEAVFLQLTGASSGEEEA
jgi:ABC-2 type transport system ATP-binding protein